MEKLKTPCIKKELDTMLAFDYLITNNDRYYGNFGFIREVDTLKFKGMAPLFDHGNEKQMKLITGTPDISFNRLTETKLFSGEKRFPSCTWCFAPQQRNRTGTVLLPKDTGS